MGGDIIEEKVILFAVASHFHSTIGNTQVNSLLLGLVVRTEGHQFLTLDEWCGMSNCVSSNDAQ